MRYAPPASGAKFAAKFRQAAGSGPPNLIRVSSDSRYCEQTFLDRSAIRFWHKADTPVALTNVPWAYSGHRDAAADDGEYRQAAGAAEQAREQRKAPSLRRFAQ